jgi:hypothetical protein
MAKMGNDDNAPPLLEESLPEGRLNRQLRFWAWYVRIHFALVILWAFVGLGGLDNIADFSRLMGRMLVYLLQFSTIEILFGPIFSARLTVLAWQHGRDFIKLALADVFLSASAFFVLLPAFS